MSSFPVFQTQFFVFILCLSFSLCSHNVISQSHNSTNRQNHLLYDTVQLNSILNQIEGNLVNNPEIVLSKADKLINYIQFSSWIYFGLKVQQIATEKLPIFINLKLTEAKLNHLISIALSYLNDDVEAIKRLFHALLILETIENKCSKDFMNTWLTIKSDCHNSLGIIYEFQKEYGVALEHYSKALTHINQSNNLANEAKILLNIGGVYYRLQQFEKSISILEEAKSKLNSNNLVRLKPKILNNLGNNYLDLGEYDKAIDYFKEALTLDQESNNPYGCAIKYGNLGSLFTQKKDYSRARGYLNLAEQLSDSLGNLQLQLDHSRFQYEFHEQLSNEKEALSYYKKHISIRDSLMNSEKIRENAKIESNFLVEKIQIEQAAKDEIKELEIQSEKNKRFNYGIILVLLLGLLIIVTILFKINRDRKRLLEFENTTMREEIDRLLRSNSGSNEPFTKAGIELLNERQKEVLELLQKGKSNREIAEALFISVNTVKYHLKAIYEVLDVKHRSNLHSMNQSK